MASTTIDDGTVRNLKHELGIEANRGVQELGDETSEDDDSVAESQGYYEGDSEDWRGCVCGKIHPRPETVFWIQCDGSCQCWFNVSEQCVGFDQTQAESLQSWLCLNCKNKLSTISSFGLLLSFPDVLMYHILKFCAPSRDRASVLCEQISPLCSTTRHAVHKWTGLWTLILKEEYDTSKLDKECLTWNSSPKQRSSKRQRRTPLTVREQITEIHLSWCAQTDDAHMALAAMTESQQCPLSLKHLRNTLVDTPNLRINRRSHCGRTFLQVCCAADYVDERVVLRCVRELVEAYGADPNVFTKAEFPDADRPVLFFAVARVMPNVVEYLIQKGASLEATVTGHFRLISDPSKRVYMSDCTPLGFAKVLKDAEAAAPSTLPDVKQLPLYLVTKLNRCIRILTEAEEKRAPGIVQCASRRTRKNVASTTSSR